MKLTPTILITGGALLCGSAWLFGGSLTRVARADQITPSRPDPVESPGGGECYKWSYPKKAACGKLSGTTECKTRPTIESSDDEKKKAECEPSKGDICLCD